MRAQAVPALLRIGDALIRDPDCAGDALGLVEVPRFRAAQMGREVAARRRDLLRWIARLDTASDWGSSARLGILVRAVHDVSLGIREAVYETGATLLLLEWPGLASRRAHILTRVVGELASTPPADLLLVRPGRRPLPPAPHILALIRGGPNAEMAARVATAMADAWDGSAELLHLVSRGHPAARRRRELEEAAALAEAYVSDRVRLTTLEVAGVPAAILRAARRSDLVVLGAYAQPARRPELVRPDFEPLLRRLPGTVILVRTLASVGATSPAERGRRAGATRLPRDQLP